MIMPDDDYEMDDDDYGMDNVAHSVNDEEDVKAIQLMVLNYGRYNNLSIIQLLGALELVKHRIVFCTYAEEEE